MAGAADDETADAAVPGTIVEYVGSAQHVAVIGDGDVDRGGAGIDGDGVASDFAGEMGDVRGVVGIFAFNVTRDVAVGALAGK